MKRLFLTLFMLIMICFMMSCASEKIIPYDIHSEYIIEEYPVQVYVAYDFCWYHGFYDTWHQWPSYYCYPYNYLEYRPHLYYYRPYWHSYDYWCWHCNAWHHHHHGHHRNGFYDPYHKTYWNTQYQAYVRNTHSNTSGSMSYRASTFGNGGSRRPSRPTMTDRPTRTSSSTYNRPSSSNTYSRSSSSSTHSRSSSSSTYSRSSSSSTYSRSSSSSTHSRPSSRQSTYNRSSSTRSSNNHSSYNRSSSSNRSSLSPRSSSGSNYSRPGSSRSGNSSRR